MLANCFKLFRLSLIVVVAAGILQPAMAKENKVLGTVLDKMQKSYDQTTGYTADFVQQTGTANAASSRVSKGVVHFKKPGNMRWDYATPNRKFIANGTTFWMVQPDRKEVVVASVESMFGSKTPMAFLSGFGQIRKEFTPKLLDSNKETATVELRLKEPTTQAQYLVVEIDRSNGMAKKVKTVDFFGAFNEISFSAYKLNPEFDEAFFTYQVPKNYKILEPSKQLPPKK